MSQETRSSTATSIWIRNEKGESVFSLSVDADDGVRGCSGKLLAQLGNGEVVAVEDPLALFSRLYDVGFQAGRKYQREKGGHE